MRTEQCPCCPLRPDCCVFFFRMLIKDLVCKQEPADPEASSADELVDPLPEKLKSCVVSFESFAVIIRFPVRKGQSLADFSLSVWVILPFSGICCVIHSVQHCSGEEMGQQTSISCSVATGYPLLLCRVLADIVSSVCVKFSCHK